MIKTIVFTPKKFIDALTLNDILFTHVVKCGLDRNYFIPRYKEGSKKIKDLTLDYKKELRFSTVLKIASTLVESGFFKDKDLILSCFEEDNFDRLLPGDLL
jgi:hypothetical protein